MQKAPGLSTNSDQGLPQSLGHNRGGGERSPAVMFVGVQSETPLMPDYR